MKQIKILTYSLDKALSNKYLEVIIQCLELEIFNEKVEVLFGFFSFFRIKPQLSHWISQVLDIVWSLSNIYLIEQSPEYK